MALIDDSQEQASGAEVRRADFVVVLTATLIVLVAIVIGNVVPAFANSGDGIATVATSSQAGERR